MDPKDPEELLEAFVDGATAAQAVVDGGAPDLDALDDYAQVLEALRTGVARIASYFGLLEPTEDDVQNARHLVEPVREGAPGEALIEPARRVARMDTDIADLARFKSSLYCIEDEASRIKHIERIKEVLDLAEVFFERGWRVSGVVSTPVDLANVRRLREIVTVDGQGALEERRRLVTELEARLPDRGNVEYWREEAVGILYGGATRRMPISDMDPATLLGAFLDGVKAGQAIVDGGAPNLDALAAAAEALEEIRLRASSGKVSYFLVNPTEDDVQHARHWVDLIREGAPSSTLIEPARRFIRVKTDSLALARLRWALLLLEDETFRAQHLGRIKEVLDQTAVLFERGVQVAGFVSTPLDLANVRRLREIVTDGEEGPLEERQRLTAELQARLPPPYHVVRSQESAAEAIYRM